LPNHLVGSPIRSYNRFPLRGNKNWTRDSGFQGDSLFLSAIGNPSIPDKPVVITGDEMIRVEGILVPLWGCITPH